MLTRLQEALQRSVAGLPLADRMKADIAAIHLADRDGDSEDVVLFGLEVLRFSPVIAIHRIASTYDVLPASVPLGRGVFVDGIRALDVTGDGIKEAVVTHGDDGSAGTVHVDVLRWVGGTESFRRIFAMALSDWGGPPCAYRFVPAANGQDIEAIVPVVGVFDGRVPHQAATQLWKYDPFADAFVSRGESVEPPKNVRQQLNEGERLLRQAELPAAVKAYHRAWSDTSLIEEEFVLTILTGVQREWPAIVAELRGTLHERLEPLDDARMRFEFAMASVAIQMQALANLLPVDQAQAHPPACVDVSPNAQRRSR